MVLLEKEAVDFLKNKKALNIQLSLTFFILIICTVFLFTIPKSSSWLHREYDMNGYYKIGRIDLWLSGIEDSVTQINIAANAPTRFFTDIEERDEFFDVAVKLYKINALNMGDIDVKVDLSYNDYNITNNTIYYIFVSADTDNSDFLAGNYRDYLENIFFGYTLDTPTQCRNAVNNINQAVLVSNTGKTVIMAESEPLFYLLVWSEYDAIPNITSSDYVSMSFSITLNAYSYQFFMSEA